MPRSGSLKRGRCSSRLRNSEWLKEHFETGSGDYATERQHWVDGITVDDIEREAGTREP